MVSRPDRPFRFAADGSDLTFEGSTGQNRNGWIYAANGITQEFQSGIRDFRITADLEYPHDPQFDAPMAAVIEGFKRLGATFEVVVPDNVSFDQQTYSFLFPLELSDEPPPRGEYFSRVWMFDRDTGSRIAQNLSDNALEMTAWASGTWDYFVLMLSEIIDNVIEHSSVPFGFVEVQIHRSGTVLMTVADCGVGVRQSFLRTTAYAPRTDEDAILLAISERVTSLPERGRGNGLWFATRNAAANNGRFSLMSGTARVVWGMGAREPQVLSVYRFNDKGIPQPGPMTVASLDFDATRAVDSIEVLGYEPVVPERERYEEGEEIVLSVAEQSRGTATRTAARQFRNMVKSLHNQSGHMPVRIDFTGVPIISLSYADELVGQLASDLGPAAFMRSVRLENANPTVQRLLDRAIDLRFRD